MTIDTSISCPFVAFVWQVIQKATTFQIIHRTHSARVRWYLYNKEITKKYHEHEIKRLSKIKNRKRSIGAAGRPFKLDIKDRFLMLLIYYRLYITYTLADGFLFDLDQSNICSRNIQKIEKLIIQCLPIPQKIYNITKRLKTLEEVERYFPAGFLVFIDCT